MKLVKQAYPTPNLKIDAEPIILRHEPSLHDAIEALGRIILPISGGYQCCKPEDILFLKAESNYTEIHYLDGSKKLLSKTLKVLEDILPSQQFFRVHKSYVVNAAHISDIILSTHERAVKLVGGHILPVSRDKKGIFNHKTV
jgi:two-component system LytT family response regulator